MFFFNQICAFDLLIFCSDFNLFWVLRYQTVSTECIPLSIGKKPLLKACKEDDLVSNNGGGRAFDPKPLRASQDHQHQHEPLLPEPERSPVSVPKTQNESNGDVLLQWGRRKRTRLSRAESRPAPEDDHESESSRPPIKVRRRSAAGSNRLGAAAAMPPPPPPPSFGRLRPSPPSLLPHRFIIIFSDLKFSNFILLITTFYYIKRSRMDLKIPVFSWFFML